MKLEDELGPLIFDNSASLGECCTAWQREVEKRVKFKALGRLQGLEPFESLYPGEAKGVDHGVWEAR